MQKNSGYFGHLGQALIADLRALGGATGWLRKVTWYGYLVSCVAGIVVSPVAVAFTALLVIPLSIRWLFVR